MVVTFVVVLLCCALVLAATAGPTVSPTLKPTVVTTANPTSPSVPPTIAPTSPTIIPTTAPSTKPVVIPTAHPTFVPTNVPTTRSSPDDPVLVSYALDSGVGKLTLTFSSLVMAHTMNVHRIVLQNTHDLHSLDVSKRVTYSLNSTYNSLAAQGNTTQLVIYLTAYDFALLKLSPPIGRSMKTTYLALLRDSVFSTDNHANVQINSSQAIPPSSLLLDTFPPYLTYFMLIMDTGLMTVKFSEPIDIDSFTLEGLVLQGSAYIGPEDMDELPAVVEAQSRSRALHDLGASVVSFNNLGRTVVVQLGTTNLNFIKTSIGLVASIEFAYLSAWKPFVNDTSGTVWQN